MTPTNPGQGLPEKPALPTPGPPTSSLQDGETTNVCRSRCPVCATVSRPPSNNDTGSNKKGHSSMAIGKERGERDREKETEPETDRQRMNLQGSIKTSHQDKTT